MFIVKKYWQHILNSNGKSGHGIHSPFVYDFVTKGLKIEVQDLTEVENLRAKLAKDNSALTDEDPGAGTRLKSSKRKISHIAKHSTSLKKNKLLAKIVHYFQPDQIIEFGTSLGFSAIYMASQIDGKVITVEGSKEIQKIAVENFKEMGLTNIDSKSCTFDEYLADHISENYKKTIAFIDGNHRYAPTITYFNFFIQRMDENCILIFDDIYWSEEMKKAWYEIKSSPQVGLSIDLFWIGILFLKPTFKKQHFKIRY